MRNFFPFLALIFLSFFVFNNQAAASCEIEKLSVTEPTTDQLNISLRVNDTDYTVLLALIGPSGVFETEVNAGTTQPIQWLHVDVRLLGGHLFLSSHLIEDGATPKSYFFGNVDPHPTVALDPPQDLSVLAGIESVTAAAIAFGVDHFFQSQQSSELADEVIDFLEENGCPE